MRMVAARFLSKSFSNGGVAVEAFFCFWQRSWQGESSLWLGHRFSCCVCCGSLLKVLIYVIIEWPATTTTTTTTTTTWNNKYYIYIVVLNFGCHIKKHDAIVVKVLSSHRNIRWRMVKGLSFGHIKLWELSLDINNIWYTSKCGTFPVYF